MRDILEDRLNRFVYSTSPRSHRSLSVCQLVNDYSTAWLVRKRYFTIRVVMIAYHALVAKMAAESADQALAGCASTVPVRVKYERTKSSEISTAVRSISLPKQ